MLLILAPGLLVTKELFVKKLATQKWGLYFKEVHKYK